MTASQFKRMLAVRSSPQPGENEPHAKKVEWLEASIALAKYSRSSPRWVRFLEFTLAGGYKHRSDVEVMESELQRLRAEEARRRSTEKELLAERGARERATLATRRLERHALERIADALESGRSPADVQRSEDSAMLCRGGESAARTQLGHAEVIIIDRASELLAISDDGFKLAAKLRAELKGRFSGTSTSVGLRSRHWSMSSGFQSGTTEASLDGEIVGALMRDEKFRRVDSGRLIVTDLRILFLGSRRTIDLSFGNLSGVGFDETCVDLKWPGQESHERFQLDHSDAVAELIAAVARSRVRVVRGAQEAATGVIDRGLDGDVPTQRQERDCPWCAEPILARARLCKHCGQAVDPAL